MRAALAAVPALCALAGPAMGVDIDDPAARLERHELANGLVVLLLEDHSTPVVSLQVWVRAGSRDEARYSGIAHLFEHMMFKGSKNLEPERHAQLVTDRGGAINAFTSDDVTVYFEDVTRESLPLVIDLEAERFANLHVDDAMLTSEREVVLEERGMRTENDPGGLAFEALAATAWMAHPYRRPVIGWRSDVEAVTVEKCQEFFDAYYAANNLVLVVAGDFDAKEALDRIRLRFGSLRRSEIERNPTREPEQRGERRVVVEFDVRSPILMAGWHAPATGHPDGAALDVASQILSDGRSSRLYRTLVDREAKALYAYGGYWELQDAGLFYASAGVRPDAAIGDVEALFFGEIDRIREAGVSEAEVAKAKRQLEVGMIGGLRTAHALASRIGRDYVAFGRVRSIDERLAEIAAVAPADVQRVVATYLVPEKRSVVHVVAPAAPPQSGAEAAR
ncbi:MAG: pitrilysin family protein [Myxococcota bacterium]|nr:insulinase family protein [Myxococcales bacterium]